MIPSYERFGLKSRRTKLIGCIVPSIEHSFIAPIVQGVSEILRPAGFHILLDKNVPDMIGSKIKPLIEDFLGRHGLTQQDIKGWILHPGGARLLGNVEIALGLQKSQTQPSWDILANVGNLSSATILFILQEWLEKRPLNPGDIALAAAFGPGFSAEFLLLQWT